MSSPRVAQEITDLILRMARDNTSWGYGRIQGALANLGHVIASNTVKNILKRHGIEPAHDRQKRTSWKAFLKAHRDVMAATVVACPTSGKGSVNQIIFNANLDISGVAIKMLANTA